MARLLGSFWRESEKWSLPDWCGLKQFWSFDTTLRVCARNSTLNSCLRNFHHFCNARITNGLTGIFCTFRNFFVNFKKRVFFLNIQMHFDVSHMAIRFFLHTCIMYIFQTNFWMKKMKLFCHWLPRQSKSNLPSPPPPLFWFGHLTQVSHYCVRLLDWKIVKSWDYFIISYANLFCRD